MASPGAPDPHHRPSSRRRGTWVVLVLLGVGVIAGIISVNYWIGTVRRTRAANENAATRPAAAPAPEGPQVPEQAWHELADLQQAAGRAMDRGILVASDLRPARDFIARYPAIAPARTLLAQLLILSGDDRGAYEQLARGLEIDADQPEAHLIAGTIASRLNQLERAEQHLRSAVELRPQSARYRAHLALAYLRRDDLAGARALLDQALQLDSESHEAYAIYSDLDAREGRLSEAIERVSRAIDRVPIKSASERRAYYVRKADLLRRTGRPEDALQVMDGLGLSDRLADEILDDRAKSWEALGNYREAAKVYEEAAQAKRGIGTWRFIEKAARLRLRAGDTDVAREHLGTLRALNPHLESIAELEKALE